jgi:hypothetical protein
MYGSIAYADQIVKTKITDMATAFKMGVAGLHVFGFKVIHPERLVLLNLTYASETAI